MDRDFEQWEPEDYRQEIRQMRHEVESMGVWVLAFLGVFFVAACWVVMLVVWG